MPQIHLCFLWHMHQPFYKDLISGEYKLPWTRLHALKDYYGMVQILEEFPQVRQTFNLVPSMVMQVQEYASGEAVEPFLECALKPAEKLSEAEQDFILQYFFQAHPQHMIYRYPRYAELHQAWEAHKGTERVRRCFGWQDLRDLQVLSQLAWFDEEFLQRDPDVLGLVGKGRNFSLEDQALMGRKQKEILGLVLPAYRRLAARGQIEISTTPQYHPILPLLCDSNIAQVSHPGVPLPSRFRYPQDARKQLKAAREFISREFSQTPAGLWPSEGSVSDEVFSIASEIGFQWTATDSGVLSRTLGRTVDTNAIYRPYRWSHGKRELGVIFRDHFLSDLIGFVYSRMGAREAAEDFLHRIRENCRPILMSGRDALVPIILDGENAWEYYDRNGRPFLRELYRLISEDAQMTAETVSEALAKMDPEPLSVIFPGSWINANFDIWIGAEEDNQAWEYLLQARETYDLATTVPAAQRKLAYEELLIAEGSDWCWWYGPEHHSENRVEFDQLYRGHLANVYRALGRTPPEELSRPILRAQAKDFHLDPSGLIKPVIDGEISSYFEWIGAGIYRVDGRSGAMHGKRFFIREALYGSDGANIFLRVDFHSGMHDSHSGLDVRMSVQTEEGSPVASLVIHVQGQTARLTETKFGAAPGHGVTPIDGVTPVECAFKDVLEIRISMEGFGVKPGNPLRFQLSLWQGGLPVDAIPQQGWLEVLTADPMEWVG